MDEYEYPQACYPVLPEPEALEEQEVPETYEDGMYIVNYYNNETGRNEQRLIDLTAEQAQGLSDLF